jgi:signal transduction histidine kinase
MDTIFVIDDDPIMLRLINGMFIGKNYKLSLFSQPEKAYQYVDEVIPDLILCDISMPEMNGFELGTLFKNDQRTKNVPLIYISALDSEENISKCFEVGAVDYITKPINYNEINARVALHLSINHLQKELAYKNKLLQKERDTLEQRVKESTQALREKDIQLIEMDRLAGTYTLAAGIAHEINTPLGIVKSGFFSLKKGFQKLISAIQYLDNVDLPDIIEAKFKEFKDSIQLDSHLKTAPGRFDRIERGIERISSIVSQFQSFGRFKAGHLAQIDINESIEQALTLVAKSDFNNLIIKKHFSKLPLVECLSTDINQCFLQVLRNAIDAVGNSGTVTIMTSYDDRKQEVVISIVDSGIGMSEDILKQVFNPFFTTKAVGEGTGLGLTISEKTIKSHGGYIMLDSEEGKGTLVIIRLPINAKPLQLDKIKSRAGVALVG